MAVAAGLPIYSLACPLIPFSSTEDPLPCIFLCHIFLFSFKEHLTNHPLNVGQNLNFGGSYSLFHLWNWVFQTNIESKAAVTLQLVVKICVHSVVQCITFFSIVLLINVKILFLNILKTKGNSVREKAKKMPFLAYCYPKSSKYLNIKTALWSKVLIWRKKSEIFHQQMHTYVTKQVIVDHKVFKLQRDSSITLHVSPKNQRWKSQNFATQTFF